ncbi:unnamed protein product, partial [Symbiodinium sp. CCMP2456]
SDLRERYPKLETQLALACSFFGLSSDCLRSAALAPAVRRTEEEIFVSSAQSFE